MAYYSVSKRNGKYCCQVRWYPGGSKKRKSKNKTFGNKTSAKVWGKRQVHDIETEISKGVDVLTLDNSLKLFGDLIERYLNDQFVKIGRSKRYSLNAIADCDIAAVDLSELRPRHFVDYCKGRINAGVSPATVACDISHMRSVLKAAKPLYDVSVTEVPIVDAMPTLHVLHLISKSNIRTRRPTEVELDRLRSVLRQKEEDPSCIIPYCDILDFSILSCMRIGEVCSIVWDDLDDREKWVWVRNRKDPRKKIGNHMKVPLLGGAYEIAKRQSRDTDPRIFPFNSKSVTTGFRRARNDLRIEDLRYHDLRREGASRLFEQGYDIARVAQVTGHKDLNTLWRIYTDLFPGNFSAP